ncbi:unnamed protein product [Bursaphelenchus xylophilus]|uniref:(pine wood nematode) hypothetical protein n=1 Tax=Bursaphelenchus xylophilus TaxID=6326 RepID=A0A1I7RPB2_BURXY|nr:unnamed protein product [Bursaphelenchus xylophilus]CAG9095722.1 unnamed protein product [Bursaphelenchus xylophilus]
MLRAKGLLISGARFGRRFTSTGQKEVPSSEQPNVPRHRTRFEYEATKKESRATSDAETGGRERPTAFQRRMLVVTGLYQKAADIPEYVSSQTMNRLHDRNRVVFIVTAVAFVFLVGLSAEQWISRKIESEKASGKSLSGMIH